MDSKQLEAASTLALSATPLAGRDEERRVLRQLRERDLEIHLAAQEHVECGAPTATLKSEIISESTGSLEAAHGEKRTPVNSPENH